VVDRGEAEAWLERETKGTGSPRAEPRSRRAHPTGLEPGIRLDPQTGDGEVVVAIPAGQDPAWDSLLEDLGFGGQIDVLEVVEVRAWEVFSSEHGKQLLKYIRARVRRRGAGVTALDVDAIVRRIRRHRPRRAEQVEGLQRALVVGLADWQLGKRDGDGTRGIVARVLGLVDAVKRRLWELRRLGRPVSRVILAGMGDLVEGCSGHYPSQTYSVELDRRRQCLVALKLLVKLVEGIATEAPEVVAVCVPGNHGENRSGGKYYTTPGDNDDVAVFEQAALVLGQAEAYSHVSFVVPDNELAVTLDVYGHVLALAHGHQAKSGGGGPTAKILRWWQSATFSGSPVGDADALMTGHYHHPIVHQEGRRWWVQCPAMDGGSDWWEAGGGAPTVAGTMTYTFGEADHHGGILDDVRVLRTGG